MEPSTILILLVGAGALIYLALRAMQNGESVETYIRREIERIGGKDIEIKPKLVWRDDKGMNFTVSFKDAEQREYYEEVRVPHSISGGRPKLQWSTPPKLKPPSLPRSEKQSSKEELIEEMDIEIKKLRAALKEERKKADQA